MGLFGYKGFEILFKIKVMMIFVGCSVVINVILNLLIIFKYGYFGVIYVFLLLMIMYLVSVYFLFKKNILWKINFLSLIKIIIVSLIFFKVVYFIISLIKNGFI